MFERGKPNFEQQKYYVSMRKEVCMDTLVAWSHPVETRWLLKLWGERR